MSDNENRANVATKKPARRDNSHSRIARQALVKKASADDAKALVEFEPKDDSDEERDTEAITKEEEWITKRKTELTTTRQIETRVQRQVVLEDGKVVDDTGPIVSTNTTEDTDKQETETTEKRDLGIPVGDAVHGKALEAPDQVDGQIAELAGGVVLADGQGKVIKKMVPRPADGLVRESNDKRVVSHEEVKDYLETEDVHHHGDFSDETYVKAVNSGVENLEEVLLSPESQQQLVPLGPRVVANTSKSFKTIDSEDTQQRSLAQVDGKIVTESKKTTEHEIIVDKDLPEKDDHSTGSREKIKTIEATQHYYKQRDEQHVDVIAEGKVVGTEMRYAAETMQVEKDGSLERPGDWDSLSDRMRKLRRPAHQKALLQPHKEVALLADRKDALTKRPLDFDREEETRKGETMKWLESHFGSESTASNDSRDDDAEVEPTKTTFFNVTIKSANQTPNAATTNGYRTTGTYERKLLKEHPVEEHPAAGPSSRSKYYQGISNWTDRKEAPANHFASKAFRDDLKETVERNRLRKGEIYRSRDKLHDGRYLVEANDNYVSREDILHQKQRQSLSSQFLAKTGRNSRDRLDDLDVATPAVQRDLGGARHVSGSRSDLHYGTLDAPEQSKRAYMGSQERTDTDTRRSPAHYDVTPLKKYEFVDGRRKSYERSLNDATMRYDVKTTHTLKPAGVAARRSPSPELQIQTNTLGRPIVPQRRRVIEKKLRQQESISPQPPKVPLELSAQRDLVEPPPDYSPPPRSRSSSPQVDYVTGARTRNYRGAVPDSGAYENVAPGAGNNSTLTRKSNQRTRFAPTTPTVSYPSSGQQSHPHMRPMMATQTTQTTPSTISTSTVTSHKSSKVGQVIGNSLRKLVNKIRSASAERKMRMKSKSKSREQSPSPPALNKQGQTLPGSATYQQYNLIDSHISALSVGRSNESEAESMQPEPVSGSKAHTNGVSVQRSVQQPFKRANSADPFATDRDADRVVNPRQRYYLGEDPYSSTLYGKENMYDPDAIGRRNHNIPENAESLGYAGAQRNNRETMGVNRRDDGEFHKQRNVSTSTLGRYQRSGQRMAGSTPNLNQDYRTTQTLPRKLHDHQEHSPSQQQYQKPVQRFAASGHAGTLEHPDKRPLYQHALGSVLPAPATGPAKPARTYAKALNRSKSFNVHAMNGSVDPSPIYIEKLTKNNYSNNLHSSQAYKSNPQLYWGTKEPTNSNANTLMQSGLKSPSIVNLISRSQKDLSKIDANEDEPDSYAYSGQLAHASGGVRGHREKDDKKQVFLRGLHQQAPDLYKSLHGGDEDFTGHRTPASHQPLAQLRHSSSLETRTPVEINKDTASIIRRDSSSNEDYVTAFSSNYARATELPPANRRIAYKEEQRRRTPGTTIISLRNMDGRK